MTFFTILANIPTFTQHVALNEPTFLSEFISEMSFLLGRLLGRDFGFAENPVLNSLVALLVYGLPALIVAKTTFWLAIKISTLKKLRHLGDFLRAVKTPVYGLIYAYVIYISFWQCAFQLNVLILRFAFHFNFLAGYVVAFKLTFAVLLTWLALRVSDTAMNKLEPYVICHTSAREVFGVLRQLLRWAIIITAILALVKSFGYDINSFLLSLGIGGAALAFASKDTIANFFGSISLIMDAPFRIGDRIQVSNRLDGYVESIGIRSTRLRNLDNTVSILPNSYLANEYIINVSKWTKRKAECTIKLAHSTKSEQMQNILTDIRQMLANDSAVDTDTINVNFKEIADSSLNISVIYFTQSTDSILYNETLERIHLAVIDIVAKNNAEMAQPIFKKS